MSERPQPPEIVIFQVTNAPLFQRGPGNISMSDTIAHRIREATAMALAIERSQVHVHISDRPEFGAPWSDVLLVRPLLLQGAPGRTMFDLIQLASRIAEGLVPTVRDVFTETARLEVVCGIMCVGEAYATWIRETPDEPPVVATWELGKAVNQR